MKTFICIYPYNFNNSYKELIFFLLKYYSSLSPIHSHCFRVFGDSLPAAYFFLLLSSLPGGSRAKGTAGWTQHIRESVHSFQPGAEQHSEDDFLIFLTVAWNLPLSTVDLWAPMTLALDLFSLRGISRAMAGLPWISRQLVSLWI